MSARGRGLGRKFRVWSHSDAYGHVRFQVHLSRDGLFSAELHGQLVQRKSYEDLETALRERYLASRTYEWSPRIAVKVSSGKRGTWVSHDAGETVAVAVCVLWIGEYTGPTIPGVENATMYIAVEPKDGELVRLEDFYPGNPLEIAEKYYSSKDDVLIPWSRERWETLHDIQAKIRTLRERLAELVSSPERIDALGSGIAGLLGPQP